VQFLANSGFPVNRGTAGWRRVRKVSHSRDWL